MFSQVQIKKFDPALCYTIATIFASPHTPVVHLKKKGVESIVQFYAKKYQSKITIACNSQGMPDTLNAFCSAICDRIKHARCQPHNYREAFIVGINEGHAVPIIYIKENKREGILVADSIARRTNNAFFQKLQELTKLPIYGLKDRQQLDMSSCYTYSLVMARDTTRLNPKTGNFSIPNLLSTLRERSIPREGYFEARLPNELLKFSQIPAFVTLHQEPIANKIIHKKETLYQFRERYSNIFIGQPRPNYLRIKGFKIAEAIEIQFYVNQLAQLAPDLWTKEIEETFIAKAKAEMLVKRELIVNLPNPQSSAMNFRFNLHQHYRDRLSEIASRSSVNDKIAYLQELELAVISKIDAHMQTPKLHQLAINFLRGLKFSPAQSIRPLVAKL